jgi:hypothetical protein
MVSANAHPLAHDCAFPSSPENSQHHLDTHRDHHSKLILTNPWQPLVTMDSPPIILRAVRQPGLEWEINIFSMAPCWTEEPSIDIISKLARKHLDLDLSRDDECSVEAFAEGAFNKLFTVDCSKGCFIFRASLPVAPHVKTKSELPTLAFVRERTDISVPLAMAYDADLANELDFEWMLMQFIDARPLHEVWYEMSWLKKAY